MIPLLDATEVQRLRKRLYRLGDWALPFPIAGVQFAVWTVASIVVKLVLQAFGVPFAIGWGSVAYLVPPVAIAWSFKGDSAEGRSPAAFAWARVVWAVSPRVVYGS